MDLTPRTLLDGLVFPESPRWHRGKLWFSDIYGRTVMRVDEKGQAEEVATVQGWPSGLGFLPDGTPLVVSMRARKVHSIATEGLGTHADLTALIGTDPNDMVVDSRGRAYVDKAGSYTLFGGPRLLGYLVLVATDGTARIVADGLDNPNGMVITPDGGTLIVAETHGAILTAFEISSDGSLSGRRLFADLEGLTPDGICLDAEGAVWVGTTSTGGFVRVLEGGEITHRIPVPGRWAVAAMLGGEDGKTLFMCTAQTTVYDLRSIRKGGVSIGWVETARVDVPHAGWP